MDPLSASASVTAVLQLATTVIKYLNGVKGATSERQRLRLEISSISSILFDIQDQAEKEAEDDTLHRMFTSLQSSDGPLEQFKSTLERLRSKLNPIRRSNTVINSVIWPFKKDEIKDLLQVIERQKTLFTLARQNDLIALSNAIKCNANDVHNELVNIRDGFLRLEENEERKSFMAWLNAPDPWINQNKASKLRHEHTGNWFIESTEYRDWLLAAHSPLWLHGIPGCGKTILASTIIQNLFQYQRIHPRAAVVFYYFDFNDATKQTYRNLIRSSIRQLVSQGNLVSERMHAPLKSWPIQYKEQSEDQLLTILHQLFQRFEEVFLVVDALDECGEREDLFRIIQQWTSWRDFRLHAIFMSRNERDVEEFLCCICDNRRTISIQSTLVDDDIHNYVQARLRDDMKLKRWRNKPQVQHLIVGSLMEKANGMFRWAACQLDALGDCLTEAKLQKALHALPRTLDETYDRILSNIKEEYQDYAFTMLQWLCFSPRPLRLEELAEVVAITSEEPWIHPEERLADPQDVLTICSTLITTESRSVEEDNFDPSIGCCHCRDRINHCCSPWDHSCNGNACTLLKCDCFWPFSDPYDLRERFYDNHTNALQTYARLAHFSVKEYLTSSRISAYAGFSFKVRETDAHLRMYASCIAYLLHINKADRSGRDLWLDFPLVFHVARNWHTHAQFVEKSQNHVPPLALRFLLNEDDSFTNWLALSQELGPPLYHASRHGLWQSVQTLLNHRVDVNATGGRHGTAIKVAIAHGHEKVVELLISNGTNVNAKHVRTLLNVAVRHGNRNIVRQLLENGADATRPDDPESGERRALELAVQNRDEHIVQMLLDHGINIGSWQAALKTAIFLEPTPATYALLNHQFTSTQLRHQSIRAALTEAVRYARPSSVRLLLDYLDSEGAVIDDIGQIAIGRIGRTALSYAAELGETTILSMLLAQNKQCPHVADNNGRTLISYAAESGDAAALQILLTYSDQEIDLADARGRTPLSYAAGTGSDGLETVVLLLENERVNANSRDHEGRTPLSYAAGPTEFFKAIGGYPSHLKRMKSRPDKHKHQYLVKRFLEHDKTASMTQDNNGWIPLSWAVQADCLHLVELLLPYGFGGLDQTGSDGETPIASLFDKGSIEILRVLSEHGRIDLIGLSNDTRAWHRISHAASRGHTELLDLLLKNSSLDIHSRDVTGRTLISLAAETGNDETLKLLLNMDSGMVDIPDKTGRTPFSYVFSGDLKASVDRRARLLLDNNAASLDLPDENGRAPISYAAEAAYVGLIKTLLDRNVDLDRPDNWGRTPLSYALSKSSDAGAVKLIFEQSTTGKTHQDHGGRTPLSYAAEAGKRAAIRFMLKTGLVDPNTPDKRGRTPLAYAEIYENERFCDDVGTPEVLRSYGGYRLDHEEPASEGTGFYTDSCDSTDPSATGHSSFTTP